MSDNKVNISGEQINYNDNNVLDALKLNPQQKKTGTIKSIIFTIIDLQHYYCKWTFEYLQQVYLQKQRVKTLQIL